MPVKSFIFKNTPEKPGISAYYPFLALLQIAYTNIGGKMRIVNKCGFILYCHD